MVITSSGQVGIGTSLPTQALDVVGNIRVSSGIYTGTTVYPQTAILRYRDAYDTWNGTYFNPNADYPLNFTALDEIGVTLTASEVISNVTHKYTVNLPAGTYEYLAHCHLITDGGRVTLTLYNITDNSNYTSTTQWSYSEFGPIPLYSKFTIASSKKFKIKTWTNNNVYRTYFGSGQMIDGYDYSALVIIKKLA